MRFTTAILGSLGLLASVASAAPTHRRPAFSLAQRQSTDNQVVVYWGQNGGGTIENNDLTAYCNGTSGIDILVLSFLYEYGNGQTIASGVIGQSCSIDQQGQGQGCEALAQGIKTCQSAGVKVIMSLGGASGAYSLSSADEATQIGQNLWNSYGGTSGSGVASTNGTSSRPFGDVSVDGWDFDIESNSGNNYYKEMITALRSNFAKDSSKDYVITGAPQCPVPEPNMGEMIQASQFDYLFVQFYNNPGCSVDGEINFDDWKSSLAGSPSEGAKIFIGVPASPLGATGTSSGAKYYLDPSSLASLVGQYTSDSAFGGIMMWAAGFSDANINNGCTYAQEASSILKTGSAC